LLFELITRAGAFYTIGDQKVQGKEKLINLLKEDEKLFLDLQDEVTQKVSAIRMGKREEPETGEDTARERKKSRNKE
jgi:hypothetical protein